MGINESGAECSNCGSYNCGYLCYACVTEILLDVGIGYDSAITILRKWNIELEDYEINDIRQYLDTHNKSGG